MKCVLRMSLQAAVFAGLLGFGWPDFGVPSGSARGVVYAAAPEKVMQAQPGKPQNAATKAARRKARMEAARVAAMSTGGAGNQQAKLPEIRPGSGPNGSGTNESSAKRTIIKSAKSGKKEPLPLVDGVAAQVDLLIEQSLKQAGIVPSVRASDEVFVRRVTLDLAGRQPTPEELLSFVRDTDSAKRSAVINRMAASEEFAHNWSRYWRDVIFMNATEARARLAQPVFEKWLSQALIDNRAWDDIATDLITATGDVSENGATALLFAHSAQAPEVASEVSRVFLGIQIQCANCHDHPTDSWKRNQFHELAAYFPRIAQRRAKGDDAQRSFEIVSVKTEPRDFGAILRENPERFISRMDKNGDHKIDLAEVRLSQQGKRLEDPFKIALKFGDANKDGALDAKELKNLPKQDGMARGSLEYRMPDLQDPSSKGTVVEPKFFVDESRPASGLPDEERRAALAKVVTSPQNPWFAKAFVNRMWGELLGEGFVMPVDDMGPGREPRFPEALDYLAEKFVASGFDVHWLCRVITTTDAYQREMRPADAPADALPFASAKSVRLRSDQVFNSVAMLLKVEETEIEPGDMKNRKMVQRNPRNQFNNVFGFDPSTPRDDVIGNVPQALFMMNSNQMRPASRVTPTTRLGDLLKNSSDNDDALTQLYLLVLARHPSTTELQIGRDYVKSVGKRPEAFEDLMWALMNSSEFLLRR